MNDDPSIEVAGGGDAGSTAAGVTASFEVAENAPDPDAVAGVAGPILGLIKFSDPDTGDTHEVTVDDDRFQVIRHPAEGEEGSSLWLTLKPGMTLDFEEAGSVMLTLTVTDDGDPAMSGTAEVTITVTNVNEAPDAPALDAADGALTVAENNEAGGNIGTLSSSDPEGGEVTFAVDDEEHFEIETVGGTTLLKYKDGAGIDFEGGKVADDGTLTIMLTATDAQGLVSEATPVKVAVTNVNEAPAIKVDGGGDADSTVGDVTASFTVAENAPDFIEDVAGPVLGLITLSDPDGDELTADSVTVSDGDRFQVIAHPAAGEEGSRLWLTLRPGVALDRETEASIELALTVTDSGDPAMSATSDPVTITVTDVNEAPTIGVADGTTPGGAPARPSIPENQAGVPVGEVTVSDEDEADADLSDRITVSDGRFEVEEDDEGGLWLKLKDGVSLDFEAAPSVDVTVTVTDSAGASASDTVTVNVGNVSEAPAITFDGDAETPDGAPAKSTVTEHAGDGEFEPVPVGEVRVSDPDGEALTIEHIKVDDDRFGLMPDDLGGIWLMLNEPLDADGEGGGEVTVKLTVTDGDGLTAEAEAVITVEGVNDSPTIMLREGVVPAADGGAGASGAIYENDTGAIYEIVVSDAEDDEIGAEDVKINDPRFEVRTDSEGGLWVFLKEPVNYEGADGESGTADDISSIPITVTVTDSGGARAMAMATVTIRNANDAPAANQEGVVVITADDDPKTDDKDERKTEALTDIDVTAGSKDLEVKLDLGAMFTDEDGDTNFSYRLENAPGGLSLAVVHGAGGSVTGELQGTVPDTSAFGVRLVADDGNGGSGHVEFNLIADDGNDEITDIILTNPDGTKNALRTVDIPENAGSDGFVIGTLAADDDDDPRHPNGRHTFEVAKDQQKNFEAVEGDDGVWVLKVKDGVTLDFEKSKGEIRLLVTAKDGGGDSLRQEVTVNVEDNNDAPKVMNKPGNWWVTVDEDLDAEDVLAGQWLTFSLETGVMTDANDRRALFVDDDADDTLTYSIVSGPAWLEFVTREVNGVETTTNTLQNKAGMVPTRGVYDVTVRATDQEGERAEDASFKIAVVLSDAGDDDNSDPDIKTDATFDIPENADEGAKLATITIVDDDLDLEGIHPWSQHEIVVVARADIDGTDTELYTINTAVPDPDPDNNFIKLVEVSRDDDSITYDIVLGPHAVSPKNTDTRINVEGDNGYDEIDFTVTVYDGVAPVTDAETVNTTGGSPTNTLTDITSNTDGADIATFDIEVDGVNEAPEFVSTGLATEAGPAATPQTHSSSGLERHSRTGVISYEVDQQNDGDTGTDNGFQEETIYLNLTELLDDPDENHDDTDYSVTASVSGGSWLRIRRDWNSDTDSYTAREVKWEDISGGAPGAAPLTWGPDDNPDGDDYVLILEVDRTGMDDGRPDPSEIAQDADGLISIVATDKDGARKEHKIAVTIADQNLAPRADGSESNGVRISDTTPREKQTITVSFDETVDPDFTGAEAGDPLAVIYKVSNVTNRADAADLTDDTATVVEAGLLDGSAGYTVKQGDVGDHIRFDVLYYEFVNGNIEKSVDADDNADADAAAALTSYTSEVTERNDPADIDFTFSTTGSTLVATPSAHSRGDTETGTLWDPDGIPDSDDDDDIDDELTFTWQHSDNGRNGWKTFDADGVADTPDAAPDTLTATIPASLAGKHVRVVVSFTDGGGTKEEVASQPVKVGAIDTVDNSENDLFIDTGSTTGANLPVGRTLRIDLSDAVPENPTTKAKGSAEAEWIATTTAGAAEVVDDGTSYTLTEADRGKTITVRVTSKDENGNVTSIITVSAFTSDGSTPVTVVAAPTVTNTRPVSVSPEDAVFLEIGAAPAKDGELESLTGAVRMADYFEDAEGDSLTFNFGQPQAGGWLADSVGATGPDDVAGTGDDTGKLVAFLDANDPGNDQLLILDEATGSFEYHTTMLQGHGGPSADDGAGNWVTTVLTAYDDQDGPGPGVPMAGASVNVNLRIDVAPTGFEASTVFTGDPTEDATDEAMNTLVSEDFSFIGATLDEEIEVKANSGGVQTNPQNVARIDVQDQNASSGANAHEYGQYTFTVEDDRFEVVPDFRPDNPTGDRSMGVLRLDTDQKLDFETTPGRIHNNGTTDDATDDYKVIYVVVTATPTSGNFDAITLRVEVRLRNDASDGEDPMDYGMNKVPGLKDNEGANDDDTLDGGTDSEDDGGTPAPMDAMAMFASSLDGGLF